MFARAATQAMASPLVRDIPPAVLALLQQDHVAEELEKQLAACAVQAEQLGNARNFHDRPPTRQECNEVVEQDRCGNPFPPGTSGLPLTFVPSEALAPLRGEA